MAVSGAPGMGAPATDEELIQQQLEIDPNLAGFFDENALKNIKLPHKGDEKDEIDEMFDDSKEIPVFKDGESPLLDSLSEMEFDEPITMTTEQFLKKMGQSSLEENTPVPKPTTLETEPPAKKKKPNVVVKVKLKKQQQQQQQQQQTPAKPLEEPLPEEFNARNFDRYVDFLKRGDVPSEKPPKNTTLAAVVGTELPLAVVSRFHDPRLNLSIERYIYNHLPDPKKNRLAKRLVLYRNSPCIVMGKNQNPFKEINFYMANMLQVPILRRYSGGGTVVHDLGNVNFSFISDKDAFNRTGFTTLLVRILNDLVGKKYKDWILPSFFLSTNDKGDMVNAVTEKKVSGSAYQLSKGRSLHHGTMLLNSNLKMLSSLLKMAPERKASIKDKCIKSIPSPVENVRMAEEVFEYACINAFGSTYGVPSFLKRHQPDNLEVLRFNQNKSAECQVLKIDSVSELPEEVLEQYRSFKTWEWVFGKTPKFEQTLKAATDLEVTLFVANGVIMDMKLSRPEPKLDQLQNQLGSVHYRGDEVAALVPDRELSAAMAWNIDQSMSYEQLGITNRGL